jgi:hypothetical protein
MLYKYTEGRTGNGYKQSILNWVKDSSDHSWESYCNSDFYLEGISKGTWSAMMSSLRHDGFITKETNIRRGRPSIKPTEVKKEERINKPIKSAIKPISKSTSDTTPNIIQCCNNSYNIVYIKEKDHTSAVFEADFSDIFKYYNTWENAEFKVLLDSYFNTHTSGDKEKAEDDIKNYLEKESNMNATVTLNKADEKVLVYKVEVALQETKLLIIYKPDDDETYKEIING